jgi:hypothetical protein
VLLYRALDDTDASVAGLFPTMSVQRSSVWDAVRDGLDEYPVEGIFEDQIEAIRLEEEQAIDGGYEIPDGELPGMWERADFEGGQEHEVRGPDWTPEEGS